MPCPYAVFAWIFTSWALLAVTPLYIYMVRGLENADFVQDDIKEISRLQAAAPSSQQSTGASSDAGPGLAAGQNVPAEPKQHTI